MASEEEGGAEGNVPHAEGSSWWESWGKSLVDTVKEKTSSTYEMVQKDLSEFYQTIQTDTAHAVVDTASKVQDQIKTPEEEEEKDDSLQSALKQGFSSILSSVSESLKTLAQEESPTSEKLADISLSSPVYDRRLVKMQQIQTEVGTYCNEPEGPQDIYLEWEKSFDFDSKRGEMSDLLVRVPEIRAIYSKLVPSVVSHGTFWKRYFFKIHQFEMEEERRAALVARAETSSLHEEEYNWDSDDVDDVVDTEPKPRSEKAVEVQVHSEKRKSDDKGKADADTKNETIMPKTEHLTIAEKKSERKDDNSFEILSPKKSEKSDITDDSSKDVEYHREISQGSLSWSNEGEDPEVTEATGTGSHFSELSSNRLSPSKEDSSSGSSVEVIRKESDELQGVRPKESNFAHGAVADSKTSNYKLLDVKVGDDVRQDFSETASTSSWVSVDDEIRVRKSKKEKFINGKGSETELTKSPESNRNSGSSSSSAVLVEKSECKSMEDEDNENDDVDIDLDEDINEEELKKIMEKIKNKSGDLDDDDDWEDWE